jgi:hypothetical protein
MAQELVDVRGLRGVLKELIAKVTTLRGLL